MCVLTWEVASEAGLSRDHPLHSGLTENGDGAFGLLAECRKSAPETTDLNIQLIIRQPFIITKNNLTGQNISIGLLNTCVNEYFICIKGTVNTNSTACNHHRLP